jgi:hypothetical protein
MAVRCRRRPAPKITSNDPLGGDEDQRAAAYSTCLAYFGSYEVLGDVIVHRHRRKPFSELDGHGTRTALYLPRK